MSGQTWISNKKSEELVAGAGKKFPHFHNHTFEKYIGVESARIGVPKYAVGRKPMIRCFVGNPTLIVCWANACIVGHRE